MAVPVSSMPLTALVDLVNGWGSTPRLEAGEQEWPYPAHDRIRDRLGVPSASVPETDEALVAVADHLHPVFTVLDVASGATTVNTLLSSSGVRPALQHVGEQLREGWVVDQAQYAVLAAAAVALRTHLAEYGVTRLGTCAGRRCADVYVDASPVGNRRFCSITCQNRARVAAYRTRHPGP
jgi:predicted RNA-binding Zn ribbon-like protein